VQQILIGIHGLKNKPPRQLLTKWWRLALREGLRKRGHPHLPFRFRLAYWSHLLHPQPLDPSITDPDDPLYLESPYTVTPVNPIEPVGNFRRKVLDLVDDGLDKIFINEDGTFNFTALGNGLLSYFFKDLDLYYTATCRTSDGSEVPLREMVQNQLLELLHFHRRKQILLIAHSMGSIIAYDTLMRAPSGIAVDTLVTIGSPLGLPVIRARILSANSELSAGESEPAVPRSITTSWFNLSDLRDKVAIDYRLADDFSSTDGQVEVIDREVVNDYAYGSEPNPHKVYGYLRTPELAGIVNEFLDRQTVQPIIHVTEPIYHSLRPVIDRFRKRL
jgi:hypothetical protein